MNEYIEETEWEEAVEKFSEYLGYKGFRQEFLKQNIPENGDVICTKDKPVKVQVSFKDGKRGMCVTAAIDDDATGWFLTDGQKGLKCLIREPDQVKLLQVFNDNPEAIRINQIRVVGTTQKGTALICEIEWNIYAI